jgi:large-conductance mechanosensitive channel
LLKRLVLRHYLRKFVSGDLWIIALYFFVVQELLALKRKSGCCCVSAGPTQEELLPQIRDLLKSNFHYYILSKPLL